jgi:hypothetical protein
MRLGQHLLVLRADLGGRDLEELALVAVRELLAGLLAQVVRERSTLRIRYTTPAGRGSRTT